MRQRKNLGLLEVGRLATRRHDDERTNARSKRLNEIKDKATERHSSSRFHRDATLGEEYHPTVRKLQ